jgi:hypothetical protein
MANEWLKSCRARGEVVLGGKGRPQNLRSKFVSGVLWHLRSPRTLRPRAPYPRKGFISIAISKLKLQVVKKECDS